MQTFPVRLLYLYKFSGQCLPIYAFYTLLFLERGQSVTDVAVLIALWSVFTIVAEVPSGVLADRWSRRNMLVLAAVLQGLCFLIWFFAQTFGMFALGFALWAVAAAFMSGTEEGLIYDNLKSDGCAERFSEVYGKAKFAANVGTIVGLMAAGLLAGFISIAGMTLLSAVVCFVNALVALRLREKNYYSERLDETPAGFGATIKEVGAFLKESRAALVSILFLVLFASLGDYLDEFDALIIHDFRLDKVWVSVILTVRFVFTAVGNVLAPLVQKRMASMRQILLLNGLASVCLLGFALIWNHYAILLFGLASLVMAVSEILLVDALQQEIKEEGRATVMSVYGIGQNIAMVGFSLIYAWLAGLFALQQVYVILALYGLIGGLSFYLAVRVIRRRA